MNEEELELIKMKLRAGSGFHCSVVTGPIPPMLQI
jgi:hypothetical protein